MKYFKRIALSSDTIGSIEKDVSSNVLLLSLEGQVLDIPFSKESLLNDASWDLHTGLPNNSISPLPLDDFLAPKVREPKLEIALLENSKELFRFSFSSNHGEGIFQLERIPLPAGLSFSESSIEYEIFYSGTHSLRQQLNDMANSGKLNLHENLAIGKGRIKLLDEKNNNILILSDIDQTFLNTDLSSKAGTLKAMFEKAEEKAELPAMDVLFRELKNNFVYANASAPYLKFISASPYSFRRVLSQKFRQKDIEIDALCLKDLQGIVSSLVKDGIKKLTSFSSYTSGWNKSLERLSSFVQPYVNNLFDQTAYKLILLLKNRLTLPASTVEILIGDNTEGDFIIFSLYKTIVENRSDHANKINDWVSFLQGFTFKGKTVLTDVQIKKINTLIQKIHSSSGLEIPLILIHQAFEKPTVADMNSLLKENSLQLKAVHSLKQKDSADIYLCPDAYSMAHVFQAAGFLNSDSVQNVKNAMLGKKLRNTIIKDEYFLEGEST